MTPVKIGPTYYVFWTCAAGYCRLHATPTRHKGSLHTSDKREAKARIAELETKLRGERARNTLGVRPENAPSTLTLLQFIDQYQVSIEHNKAETTRRNERGRLRSLVAFVGDVPLSGLTQDVLERFKQARLKRIVPHTWNSQLGTYKAIFGWGLLRQPPLYTNNPFDALTGVPAGDPTIKKYVGERDIAKVVQHCPDPFYRNVMAFLYASFCRSAELRGLKWTDVYRDRGYVHFRHPKEEKKGKKEKHVAITAELTTVLDTAKILAGTSLYVFPGWRGGKLGQTCLYDHVRQHGAVVGVKLSPHRFRHSGITDALEGGAALYGVQAVAGHSRSTTTEKYFNKSLDAQRAAMGKLNVAPLLKPHPEPEIGN